MSRQAVLTALPYILAAGAAPVLAYLLQPRLCFDHLFLPYVLPVLVLLCLTTAGAQSFIRWSPGLREVVGIVFGVCIQAVLVVPCVSDLEDSSRVMRLVFLSLWMTSFSAVGLAINAAGLLHAGQGRSVRAVAASGFLLAGVSLAFGSAKQYLGMAGLVWSDPFVALSEARMPLWLMAGVAMAALGTAAAHLQRLRQRPHGPM